MGGDRVNRRPLIEIVCDGNSSIGFGHIRRSLALAAVLQQQQIEVRLTGFSEEASRQLPEVHAGKTPASVVLFDVPDGAEEAIKKAKQKKQITVTLDWFGDEISDINIAVYPHHEVRSLVRSYVGFEYILLREEIREIKPHPFSGNNQKVLVCLGGGDLLSQGLEAATCLHKQGFEVILVQGPYAKPIDINPGFAVTVHPPDFAKLLANCDWCVTNGGGVLFESIYLQKPAYVLPQTEWEMRIAQFVNEHQGVLGIGRAGLHGFTVEELKNVLAHERMIDGKGAERIAAIIKKTL